jgi:hypothetical protein
MTLLELVNKIKELNNLKEMEIGLRDKIGRTERRMSLIQDYVLTEYPWFVEEMKELKKLLETLNNNLHKASTKFHNLSSEPIKDEISL